MKLSALSVSPTLFYCIQNFANSQTSQTRKLMQFFLQACGCRLQEKKKTQTKAQKRKLAQTKCKLAQTKCKLNAKNANSRKLNANWRKLTQTKSNWRKLNHSLCFPLLVCVQTNANFARSSSLLDLCTHASTGKEKMRKLNAQKRKLMQTSQTLRKLSQTFANFCEKSLRFGFHQL